jgi:hypothetical protein
VGGHKNRLGFEPLNCCMSGVGRAVSADKLDILLSLVMDVHMLNYEDAFHDASCRKCVRSTDIVRWK